jgi:hypothetical protein
MPCMLNSEYVLDSDLNAIYAKLWIWYWSLYNAIYAELWKCSWSSTLNSKYTIDSVYDATYAAVFALDSAYNVIYAKIWICSWSLYNAIYAEPQNRILLNMNAKLWKKEMFLIQKAVKQVQFESEYCNTLIH